MMMVSILLPLIVSQGSIADGNAEFRLREQMQAVADQPLSVPGFTFLEPRVFSRVIPSGAQRPASLRVPVPGHSGSSDESPGGQEARFGVRATATGSAGRGHRLTIWLRIFSSTELSNHASKSFYLRNGPAPAIDESGTAPSGLPIGRRTWPLGKGVPTGAFAVVVQDENLLLRVNFEPGAVDSRAANVRFQPNPADIVATAETLTRHVLARAQAARAGLGEARTSGVVRMAAGSAPRRLARGATFAGVRNLGKLEQGVLRFSSGGRQVVAPLGAYEIRVNGRRVPLRQPVMEADGQVWVEATALR